MWRSVANCLKSCRSVLILLRSSVSLEWILDAFFDIESQSWVNNFWMGLIPIIVSAADFWRLTILPNAATASSILLTARDASTWSFHENHSKGFNSMTRLDALYWPAKLLFCRHAIVSIDQASTKSDFNVTALWNAPSAKWNCWDAISEWPNS